MQAFPFLVTICKQLWKVNPGVGTRMCKCLEVKLKSGMFKNHRSPFFQVEINSKWIGVLSGDCLRCWVCILEVIKGFDHRKEVMLPRS